MTNIVYTYNNFSWIGPNVNTIEKIIKTEIIENTINVQYKYYSYENDKKYVILSNYCLLEDTVLGLPRSYNECFKNIMKMIEDEIYLGNTEIIKTCLQCNKIIQYLEWN